MRFAVRVKQDIGGLDVAMAQPVRMRSMQRAAVDALLSLRPADGFHATCGTDPGTLAGYVAHHLYWYMRTSLDDDDEEPDDVWLCHDKAVVLAVGVAEHKQRVVSPAEKSTKEPRLRRPATALLGHVGQGHVRNAHTLGWAEKCEDRAR